MRTNAIVAVGIAFFSSTTLATAQSPAPSAAEDRPGMTCEEFVSMDEPRQTAFALGFVAGRAQGAVAVSTPEGGNAPASPSNASENAANANDGAPADSRELTAQEIAAACGSTPDKPLSDALDQAISGLGQ